MKIKFLPALVAFTVLGGLLARADNMATIAIAPATGVVTLTPRWAIGSGLAGFHEMAQDLSLGGGANQFHSIKAAAIPPGGDVTAFTLYIAASGAATPHADIGSKLTPNSYSALTSADPDVGYGAINFYFIHHKATGDYFTAIKPSSGTASAVTDLKPMNGPGGPATGSIPGYFGLTFAAADLGYGANLFYYFRTDPVTGFTKFGTLIPALLGTSADKFDLGISGHNALDFTGTDVGFGTSKMYYARLDPVTGFTIFGTLDPLSGKVADIANLGSVYSTLDFVPGDVGFGTNKFYTTGAVNPTWQSVSFAAIADRAISAGSFTVSPSASSALAITLTVVSGSTGSATISAPVGGVFTITPTAPGVITLQATQAGSAVPAFEFNMLRQSFTASGPATAPVITNSTLTAAVTAGSPFSYTITASNSPTSFSASPLPAGLSLNASTGLISGIPTTAGSTNVILGATNAGGTATATLAVLIGAGPAAPVAPTITNNPAVGAPATTGTAFSYTITASGSPTSFTASPLPAGLSVNAATGVISGTPTATGTTVVTITATNATGTASSTLTITVAASNVAPIVTSPAAAPGTMGTPFVPFTVAATGSPTAFSASGLPPGLIINAQTGVISGTPTSAGTFTVTITVTNASGTTTSNLTITIAGNGSASSRIINFSARALSGPGSDTLIMGFVVSGNGKNLLVRGVGPGLSAYGIANALPDPMLTLFTAAGDVMAANDDWQTTISGQPDGTLIAPTAARVGAFPLLNGSKDSSLLITLNNGAHTTSMLRPNGAGGVALTEIYDTDSASNPGGARIVNVAARMKVTAGEGVLIAGLIIGGNAPKTVLVRGIGPALSAFAVTGVLADPQIAVFSGGTQIAANDDWGTGTSSPAQIAAASAQVGAFSLPAGSKDSALLVTLQPGAYTVQVTGVGNTEGVALIEIYDTQ